MNTPVMDMTIGMLDIRNAGGTSERMLYRYSKTEFFNDGYWHDLSNNSTPVACLYFIPVELV